MNERMEAIIRAFAEVSMTSVDDLTGYYGSPVLRRQRKILWVLLSDMAAVTFRQIAQRFGGRNPSTVSEQVAVTRGEAALLEHAAQELQDWRLRLDRRLRDADPRGAIRLVKQAEARGQPTPGEWDQLVATLVSIDVLLTAPGLQDRARLSGLRAIMDREAAA